MNLGIIGYGNIGQAVARLAVAFGMNVIASGGVSCLEDIEKLKETGVKGVIVGKAIYTGNVELKEAIRIG